MEINSCDEQPLEKKLKCADSQNGDVEKCENAGENNNEMTAANDSDEDSGNVEDDSDSLTFPPDEDVSDMLEEVSYAGRFPTITERYFTAYYKLDVREPGDDIRVLMHSNRICMLTLAPSHPISRNPEKVVKIDFKVSEKLDRSRNKVSGKSKHGAQPLQANSNICTISLDDGKVYTVKCCVIGKLVEVNEALMADPKLLSEPPHRSGYLAIMLPNIKLLDKIKADLLTEEQYKEAMARRQDIGQSNGSKENCNDS